MWKPSPIRRIWVEELSEYQPFQIGQVTLSCYDYDFSCAVCDESVSSGQRSRLVRYRSPYLTLCEAHEGLWHGAQQPLVTRMCRDCKEYIQTRHLDKQRRCPTCRGLHLELVGLTMDRLRLRWSKQKAETRARNKTNRVVVPTDMSKEPFPWTWEQVGSPAFKRALAREIEAHLETLEPLFPRVYAGAYEDDGCYVCEDYAEESTAHRARLSTAGCPVVLCQECFDRWGEIFGIETLNIAEEALYYARLHQSYSPTTYSYVYRLFSIDNALLYVGKSNRVVKRFYSNGGHFDTKDWWNDVASASVSVYSSEIEALEAEAHAIYSEKPLHNKVVPHRYLSKAPRMLSKTFGSLV